MPQGIKDKNGIKMAIKVTIGQISDGTISQKHVLRSTIYVESLIAL